MRNNLLPKPPSLREIARTINELGLAHKKIGPRDTRTYPMDKVYAPGTITLDLWGPWHIRAGKMYLITCQDRHTRLSVAVPTNFLKFSRESQPGVHENLREAAQSVPSKQALLPDLAPDEFADLYAQTIAYGLFAARVHATDAPRFTRADAAALIRKGL